VVVVVDMGREEGEGFKGARRMDAVSAAGRAVLIHGREAIVVLPVAPTAADAPSSKIMLTRTAVDARSAAPTSLVSEQGDPMLNNAPPKMGGCVRTPEPESSTSRRQ
jgi:hypothetical protein